MKLKVVGHHGFTVNGTNVFPGEIFEVDEGWGRQFISQGRAVEVKEEEASPAPPPSEPEVVEPDEEEEQDDDGKPTGRKRKKK